MPFRKGYFLAIEKRNWSGDKYLDIYLAYMVITFIECKLVKSIILVRRMQVIFITVQKKINCIPRVINIQVMGLSNLSKTVKMPF